jgi:hypothetical protein
MMVEFRDEYDDCWMCVNSFTTGAKNDVKEVREGGRGGGASESSELLQTAAAAAVESVWMIES